METEGPGHSPSRAGSATAKHSTEGDFRMKHSRITAAVSRPGWRHGLSLMPFILGALLILVLLAGQAQPVSAQYPVLPTPTAAPAPPTQRPATATPVPPPPTATPIPAPPTATVAAPAPTTPPVAEPTVAPTKPATQPTVGAPATAAPVAPVASPTAVKTPAAANPTATPAAALSAPQAATATSRGLTTAVQSEDPVQSALRGVLTGLGTLWLVLGVVVFGLALVGVGYLFKNRGSGN